MLEEIVEELSAWLHNQLQFDPKYRLRHAKQKQ
jgi:hypothetical protein